LYTIDGINSLHEQNCIDEPLLEIAEIKRTTLGFVHIVPPGEADKLIPCDIEKSEENEEDENEFVDLSSEEEFEFE